MPAGGDIVIVGAEKLDAVGRRLRAAGEHGKGLRKELQRSIRQAANPLVRDVRASALELPRRGGLASRIRTGIGVRTRVTGPSAGVRIVAKNRYSIARINKGTIRHPVFGHSDRWVAQPVEPGWFDRPVEKHADDVREAVMDAVHRIARKVEG